MSNRRVLLVDDEVNVVEGLKRQLRKCFDVSTSTDPQEALAILEAGPGFAVVLSDMRMPQMSGIEFLTEVKRARPDIIRVMLTGNQDQLTAASAVNHGEVFRFLNKPCDSATLTATLEQALRQHQLVTAERELLTKTLQGSIKVLIEALSITKPELFGSIDRIERQCIEVTQGLEGIETWEMRAAARLSRLGCLGVDNDTLEAISNGEAVSAYEESLYQAHPQTGARLLAEIPRLQGVANAILYQHKNYDGSGFPADECRGNDIPLGARVLRLVWAYDEFRAKTCTDVQALASMSTRAGWFDPDLLERLSKCCRSEALETFRIAPDKLYNGLTFAEDVHNLKGLLLVCRGQVVTPAIKRHLQNFYERGALTHPVLVSNSS